MRSFNTDFITEKNSRADGPAPINLLTFNFSTPVYLSDRNVTPSGGSLHKGLVKDWGFIDSHVIRGTGNKIIGEIPAPDLALTIINSESTPFSANFTDSDPPENVTVELYQWFSGLLYSEKELLFKGFVSGLLEYNPFECKLTIRNIWEKYNKLIGDDLIINPTDYRGADPDDIGKMLPLVWGEALNVPFRAVDAGAISTLVSDITASSTTLTLSDGSRFPSSGIVYVGSEQITYTGNSNNQLAGCTRGAGGTTAVAHSAGTGVAEKQTEYIYLIGNAVKSIDNVYVGNVRQTTGFTAYTGQTGDAHSSYPGKACLAFNALPTNRKLVDTISVESRGSYRCNSTDSNIPHTWNSVSDGDETISISDGGNYFAPTHDDSKNNNGHSVTIHWRVVVNDPGTAGWLEVIWDDFNSTNFGRTLFKISSGSIVTEATHPCIIYKTNNTLTTSLRIRFEDSAQFNGDVTVYIDAIEVEFFGYEQSVEKTGEVAITGNSVADTVIGAEVSADLKGYQDDASGTYTGTANLLIERPNHVFKHIWNAVLGASLSDIDSTTFNNAGDFFDTNSYEFALVIQEPIMADELLTRLAVQCRSHFFVTLYGKAKLIVRQLSQSSAHNIPKDEIQENSVYIERSPVSELCNHFNIYYDLDHLKGRSKENCRASKKFSDSTSITRYGQREWKGTQDAFFFDSVRSDSMVDHVGSYWLDFVKKIRKIIHFGIFLDNMETEPGDIIDLSHDLDEMNGFVCEIIKVSHFLGSAQKNVIDHLELIAIEN